MWKIFIICASAMAVLTGCGNAVDEATSEMVDNPQSVKNEQLIEVGALIGTGYSGFVPETIPGRLLPLQTRLVEELSLGLPSDVFAGVRLKPENSIGRLGSGNKSKPSLVLIDGKYQMHLVARNIEAISESAVLSCDSGSLYRAFIAVKPYLGSSTQGASLKMMSFAPYELHFCDTSDGFSYALAAEGDAVRAELGISAFGDGRE